ncbi:MAG: T9SS type A sorting domain-containing protein, partial [Flavobacteriales bacterium]
LGVERDGTALELSGALGARSAMPPPQQPWDGRSHRWQGMDPTEQEALRREMDELRREMDELRRELGKDIRRDVRVRVQARPLSEEEKALLRRKGVSVDKELPLNNGLSVFPNPSNGFFRIQFEVPERGDLSVDVHDAKGERVYQERIAAFKGRYERTLDLSDMAAGSYFLVVAQGGRAAMVKLVKE